MHYTKIFRLFLYSFTIMYVVAPGHVNAASFQLTWVDNSQDEDGFNIERKLGTNETFSLIATVGPDVTSYSDENLANSTTYCYRVNAFNSAGNSDYTNEACRTTPTSPSAPSPTPLPTPPPLLSSTVTATLLGQTGEDIAGTTSETPDDRQDVHIRLSGVRAAITGVKITGSDFDGRWETPFNGGNWVVAIRPQTDPSFVDLYFDFLRPNSFYTLELTFVDGSTQTIQTSALLSTDSFGSSALVTLAATPVAGSFAGGSLAGCSSGAVNMDASKSCAATSQTAANQIITKIGVFRPNTGEWFLDQSGNGQWDGCGVDTCISSFGQPGDLPVIGSWSGAGASNIGTFDPTLGTWQLDRNGNGQWDGCAVDTCITSFGQPGDLPLTREINGFNGTIIGTFQPQSIVNLDGKNLANQGLWKFDLNGNNGLDSCSIDECAENFGTVGDLPVVGDWNGSGTEEIGLFRPSTGEWFLDVNGNGQWDGCGVDKCLGQFGGDGDLPVVGDWDGTGEVGIGIFRPSTAEWFLDMNRNGKFDGCEVDACLGPFGAPGDLPVVGKWR